MAGEPEPGSSLGLPAHALGDEPALAGVAPPGLPTFESICRDRRAATPRSRMLLAAVLAAIVSGPFAVLGALIGPGALLAGGLAIIVVAPLAEEMLKVAGALHLVEVRPWLVPSAVALVAVAVCSGLVFAAIENGFYLWVYIDDPTPEVVRWRWVFGPLVHGTGSLLAGIGVARMWQALDRAGRRPDFRTAVPWIVAAVVVHGGYNAFATWLEVFGGGI